MDKDLVAQSYEYGIWANRRLLKVASELSQEQLHRSFTQGAQPILHTFVHLVSAEWRWFQSWQNLPMMDPITVDDLPTLDAAQERWEPLYSVRREFIAALTPARLAATIHRKIKGQDKDIPLWLALLHVANHGTQHRSEIAAMLTDAGHSPGDLDMTLYFVDRAGMDSAS